MTAAPASPRDGSAAGGPGTPHRVVIVGGGAAGLDLAIRLCNRLGRDRAVVTLVDRNGSYVWKPRLHEVAAGTLDAGRDQVEYLASASRHGYRFRPGILRSLDRNARRVTLGTVQDAAGRDEVSATLDYDTLVLALGSRADDFGTPGALEHCRFIDARDQAEAFNAALRDAIVRHLDDPDECDVSVAIVGAGATGVELSAELHHALDLVSGYGLPRLRRRLRITLLEAAPRILPSLPERVSRASAAVLRDLGVTVLTGTAVASVDAEGLTLRDGRRVDAVLRVWAAGIRAPEVLRGLGGLENDRAGRIKVDPDLRSVSDLRVFALGDCASLVPPGGEKPLPATAQVAHQQARHLAGALAAHLREGTPLPPFRYKERGALVSLGGYDAFGSLGRLGVLPGGFIAGRFAQFSYAMLYRQYQWVVHGLRAPLVWLSEAASALAKPRVRLD